MSLQTIVDDNEFDLICRQLTIKDDLILNGNVSFATLSVSSTINATDNTTGALKVAGGGSVQKDFFVGGTLTCNNIVYKSEEIVTNTEDSTSITTGAFQVAGGGAIVKNFNVGGVSKVWNTTQSTSKSTGALQVLGGASFVKNVNVGGNMTVTGTINGSFTTPTTDSSSTSSGGLVLAGGLSVAKTMNISHVNIVGGTPSTNTITGDLVVSGGVGISNNINVGGNLKVAGGSTLYTTSIISSNNSSDSTTGALTVTGGAGISGNLHVGGELEGGNTTINGTLDIANDTVIYLTTDSTSTATGALLVKGGAAVVKDLWVGGTIHGAIAGEITTSELHLTSSLDTSNTGSGALTVAGGAGIGKKLNVGGVVRISDTSSGTTTTTGALFVSGGLNIRGVSHLQNNLFLYSPSDLSKSTFLRTDTAGYMHTVAGRIYLEGPTYTDGLVTMRNGTDTTKNTTFNVDTSGSLTINTGGNILNIDNTDQVKLLSTNDATNSLTGALMVNGGAFIGGTIMQGRVEDRAKLVMYQSQQNEYQFYGMGIQTNEFRTQLASNGAHCSVYAGIDSTSDREIMRLEGGLSTATGLKIFHTIDAAGTSTGALVVNGGTNISKNLIVGRNIFGLSETVRVHTGVSLYPSNWTLIYKYTGSTRMSNEWHIKGVDGTEMIQNLRYENDGSYSYVYHWFNNRQTTPQCQVWWASGDLRIYIKSGFAQFVWAVGSPISEDLPLTSAGTGTDPNDVAGLTKIDDMTLPAGNIRFDGTIRAQSTTEASNTATGAMIVSGGVSIAKQLHTGDGITIHNITDATKLSSLTVDTSGVLNINAGGNICTFDVSDQVNIKATTQATSATTGALVVNGGIGCAKDIYCSNLYGNVIGNVTTTSLVLTSTTEATSLTTGALVVYGGAAIAKNLYVGGDIIYNPHVYSYTGVGIYGGMHSSVGVINFQLLNNSMVSLFIPEITGLGSNTTIIYTDMNIIPSEFRSTNEVWAPIVIVRNNVNIAGMMRMEMSVGRFWWIPTGTDFNSDQTNGWRNITITYSIM